MVAVKFKQLEVMAGQRLLIRDVDWQEFEAILEELGDHRASRIAYYQGNLEIRRQLPEHERSKIVIADLIKILLNEMDIAYEPYGSTTFKNRNMAQGIEPDDCFYIKNAIRMIGKTKIDLAIDPPPDLAIEVDVTSKTQLSVYQGLRVPELWRWENNKLRIDLWQNGEYVQSLSSLVFPNVPILEIIPQYLEMASAKGTSSAMKAFRKWVIEFDCDR